MEWFKFYGSDWLTDLKVQDLSPIDRVCFVGLMCFASQSMLPNNEIKDFTEVRFLRVMQFAATDYDNALGFSQRLEALGMITLGNGSVIIPRFTERQHKNLTGYERVKRYRERQKSSKQANKNDNADNEHDNAREEKNRIEENTHAPKIEKTSEYLRQIPEPDIHYFTSRFQVTPEGVRSKAEDLRVWCASNGKRKKNYKAFLFNAIKRDFRERPKPPPPDPDKDRPPTPEEQARAVIIRAEISEKLTGKRI